MRAPACVNPGHLDAVEQGVNIKRGRLGYPLRRLCRKGLHDVTDYNAWYIGTSRESDLP